MNQSLFIGKSTYSNIGIVHNNLYCLTYKLLQDLNKACVFVFSGQVCHKQLKPEYNCVWHIGILLYGSTWDCG